MCNPVIAVALTVASAAMSYQQQQVAARNARTVANAKAAQARNRGIAAQQDIAADKEREQIRRQLIGQEGQGRAGEINVALAANGVQLGGADSTSSRLQAELAGEVAFRKLISQDEHKLRERNLLIEAQDAEFQAGLYEFEARASKGPSILGTALKTGAGLATDFHGVNFGGGGGGGGRPLVGYTNIDYTGHT